MQTNLYFLLDARDVVVCGLPRVRLFCLTESGEDTYIDVLGTPCTLLVAATSLHEDKKSKLTYILNKFPPPCRDIRCTYHAVSSEYGIGPGAREGCSDVLGMDDAPIVSWSLVQKKPFEVGRRVTSSFLEVGLARPWDLSRAASWLKKNISSPTDPMVNGMLCDKLMSAREYLLRDKGLSGYEWFSAPGNVCHHTQILKVTTREDRLPLRVLTLDIETLAVAYRDDETAQALYPVIVVNVRVPEGKYISLVLKPPPQSHPEPIRERSSDNAEGEDASPAEHERYLRETQNREVRQFDTEEELFMCLDDLVISSNMHVLVGYNHTGYDLPYLSRRSERLGVPFGSWGKDGTPYLFEEMTQQKKDNIKVKTQVDIHGVLVLDLRYVAEDLQLDQHKLSDVAGHFQLGNKGDVHYDEIYPMYMHGGDSLDMIVKYCERDVWLTWRVLQKFDEVNNRVNKSVVQRCLGRDTVDRGISFTLTTLVRSFLYPRGFALPVPDKVTVKNKKEGDDGDEGDFISVPVLSTAQATIPGYREIHKGVVLEGAKYAGAYVLEPKCGLIRDPVITLDFSSLYPNTARSGNFCPSTLIPGPNPEGGRFTFTKEWEGILPQIWTTMLGERQKVKDSLKLVPKEDEDLRRQRGSLEKQYKLAANSLYGQFGARVSPLCCIPVASSITSQGQTYIKSVKSAIEAEYAGKIEVVYGDTDSLFVRLVGITPQEAFVFGDEIVRFVNRRFEGTSMKMEFENVSCPLILNKKKKYSKNIWDRETMTSKVKLSGMEMRSACKFVTRVTKELLSLVMQKGGGDEDVRRVIRERATQLFRGEVPLADLVHSSKLSAPIESYKVVSGHIVAAKQMIAAGMEVKPGDRVKYVNSYVIRDRADKDKKSPLAIALPIFKKEGHTPHYEEYAEELAASLSKTCLYLLKGGESEIREVVSSCRGARVRQTLKRVSNTGPMDAFFKKKTILS